MNSKIGAKIFLILFMIPFLGVGIWMGSMTFLEMQKVEKARSWNEMPAEITSCILQSHRGSKGGYTYQVTADYTYTVNSKKYTSSKVSFYSGSDNVGSFHQNTFHKLETARLSKKTFPCWVNPENPEEVVLIRDLRPEMMTFQLLFVFLFGGAAIAVLCSILFSYDSKRLSNGNICMRKAGLHLPLLISAMLTDTGTGWMIWKLMALIGLLAIPWHLWLCIIPGLILTSIAVYMWLRFSKFGVSELMLSSSTLRLGDRMNATVMIPKMVEGDFKGVLTCTHQYTTGSGKQRSTHHDVLWSSELMSGGTPTGSEMTHVSFHFELPIASMGVQPTHDTGSTKYYWRLVVSSDMPGVDYKAEFDIVVE
ncbi:MAG: DUF3592 domain-containing protein [bacterium]